MLQNSYVIFLFFLKKQVTFLPNFRQLRISTQQQMGKKKKE